MNKGEQVVEIDGFSLLPPVGRGGVGELAVAVAGFA
jgi:hypothetical protein